MFHAESEVGTVSANTTYNSTCGSVSPGNQKGHVPLWAASEDTDLNEVDKSVNTKRTRIGQLDGENSLGESFSSDENKRSNSANKSHGQCVIVSKLVDTYICEICNDNFAELEEYSAHVKIHVTPKEHVCPHCKKSFSTAYKRDVHIEMNSGVTYTCDECAEEFQYACQLPPHQREHEERGMTVDFPCVDCDQRFTVKRWLHAHIREAHSKCEPFICPKCNQKFYYAAMYNTHMLRHEGDEKVLKCVWCSAMFTKRFDLQTHIYTHADTKPYRCSECDLSFRQPKDYSKHKLLHKLEKQCDDFPCVDCHQKFSAKSSLEIHIRESHSQRKIYSCPKCDENIFCAATYNTHVLRHENEEHLFKCVWCLTVFTERLALTNHIYSHTEGEVYTCSECDLSFRYPGDYYKHRLISKQERKCSRHIRELQTKAVTPGGFPCVDCDQKFTSRRCLQLHTRKNHSKRAPFACPKCNEKIFYAEKYNKHVLMHESLNNVFKCVWCLSRFANRLALREHIFTHAEARGYVCLECDSSFRQFNEYYKHRLRSKQENGCSWRSTDQENKQVSDLMCVDCELKFISKRSLRLHILTAHSKRKAYTCPICDKKIFYAVKYNSHMLMHEGDEKRLKCIKCSTTFTDRLALKQHIKFAHAGANIYVCSECDCSFRMLNEYYIHKLNHNQAKEYIKCSVCSLLFADDGKFIEHFNQKHNESEKFTCGFCDRKFSRRREIENHLNRHLPEGLKVCTLCDTKLVSRANLKKHCINVHFLLKRYACVECNFRCQQLRTLQIHTIGHMNLFQCPDCQEKLRSEYALKKHKKEVHQSSTFTEEQNITNYLANDGDECSRKFSSLSALDTHKETHVEHFPRSNNSKQNNTSAEEQNVTKTRYKCEECNRKFSDLSELEKHVETHIEDYADSDILEVEADNDGLNMLNATFNPVGNEKGILGFENHKSNSAFMRYSCDKCSLVFSFKYEYNNHCLNHLEELEDLQDDSNHAACSRSQKKSLPEISPAPLPRRYTLRSSAHFDDFSLGLSDKPESIVTRSRPRERSSSKKFTTLQQRTTVGSSDHLEQLDEPGYVEDTVADKLEPITTRSRSQERSSKKFTTPLQQKSTVGSSDPSEQSDKPEYLEDTLLDKLRPITRRRSTERSLSKKFTTRLQQRSTVGSSDHLEQLDEPEYAVPDKLGSIVTRSRSGEESSSKKFTTPLQQRTTLRVSDHLEDTLSDKLGPLVSRTRSGQRSSSKNFTTPLQQRTTLRVSDHLEQLNEPEYVEDTLSDKLGSIVTRSRSGEKSSSKKFTTASQRRTTVRNSHNLEQSDKPGYVDDTLSDKLGPIVTRSRSGEKSSSKKFTTSVQQQRATVRVSDHFEQLDEPLYVKDTLPHKLRPIVTRSRSGDSSSSKKLTTPSRATVRNSHNLEQSHNPGYVENKLSDKLGFTVTRSRSSERSSSKKFTRLQQRATVRCSDNLKSLDEPGYVEDSLSDKLGPIVTRSGERTLSKKLSTPLQQRATVTSSDHLEPLDEPVYVEDKKKYIRYSCDECKLNFSKKIDLETHLLSHKERSVGRDILETDIPDKDDRVDLTFDVVADGNLMVLGFEASPKKDKHLKRICERCSVQFSFKYEYNNHMLSHLEESDEDSERGELTVDTSKPSSRMYSCGKCSSQFERTFDLRTHMFSHVKVSAFVPRFGLEELTLCENTNVSKEASVTNVQSNDNTLTRSEKQDLSKEVLQQISESFPTGKINSSDRNLHLESLSTEELTSMEVDSCSIHDVEIENQSGTQAEKNEFELGRLANEVPSPGIQERCEQIPTDSFGHNDTECLLSSHKEHVPCEANTNDSFQCNVQNNKMIETQTTNSAERKKNTLESEKIVEHEAENDVSTQAYSCNVCLRKFLLQGSLDEHLFTHSETSNTSSAEHWKETSDQVEPSQIRESIGVDELTEENVPHDTREVCDNSQTQCLLEETENKESSTDNNGDDASRSPRNLNSFDSVAKSDSDLTIDPSTNTSQVEKIHHSNFSSDKLEVNSGKRIELVQNVQRSFEHVLDICNESTRSIEHVQVDSTRNVDPEQDEQMETAESIEQKQIETTDSVEQEQMETADNIEQKKIETKDSVEQEQMAVAESTEHVQNEQTRTRESNELEQVETSGNIEHDQIEATDSIKQKQIETEGSVEQDQMETADGSEQKQIESRDSVDQEQVETTDTIEQRQAETRESVEQEQVETADNIETRDSVDEQEQMAVAESIEHVQNEQTRTRESNELEQVETSGNIEHDQIEATDSIKQKQIETEGSVEQEQIESRDSVDQEQVETTDSIERRQAETRESVEQEQVETADRIEQRQIDTRDSVEQEQISVAESTEHVQNEQTRATESNELEQVKTSCNIEHDQIETADRIKQKQIETTDSIKQKQIETEGSVEQMQIESRDSVDQEQVETTDSIEERQVETRESVVQEQVETADRIEQRQIETRDSVEQEQMAVAESTEHVQNEQTRTRDSNELEQVETSGNIEQKQIETRDSVDQEQVETADSIEQKQIETKDCVEEEQVETADSIEQKQIETRDSVDQEQVETADNIEQKQIETRHSVEQEQMAVGESTEHIQNEQTGTRDSNELEQVETLCNIEHDQIETAFSVEHEQVASAKNTEHVRNETYKKRHECVEIAERSHNTHIEATKMIEHEQLETAETVEQTEKGIEHVQDTQMETSGEEIQDSKVDEDNGSEEIKPATTKHSSGKKSEVKRHTCDICSKEFDLKQEVDKHLLSHLKRKAPEQPEDTSVYNSSASEQVLNGLDSDELVIKRHCCDKCKAEFETVPGLNTHTKSCHVIENSIPEKSTSAECVEQQTNTFAVSQSSNSESEKWSNQNAGPSTERKQKHLVKIQQYFTCDTCSERFSWKPLLDEHVLTHTEIFATDEVENSSSNERRKSRRFLKRKSTDPEFSSRAAKLKKKHPYAVSGRIVFH